MDARDRKISQWKGGRLSVYRAQQEMHRVGESATGEALYEPRLTPLELVEQRNAIPLGQGFALLLPATMRFDELGVELRFEIRDDRIQCVEISSLPDGPELTQTLIRTLKLEEATRQFAASAVVRLELGQRGGVIGIPLFVPRDPWDWRTQDDIERELGATIRRPGRPPISNAELRQVAEIVQEAQRSRQPTAAAVAKAFSLTLDAAKKRIQKTRARGFLPPTEPRKARSSRAGKEK